MRKATSSFLLVILLLSSYAEERVQSAYHFGPHAKHDLKTLSVSKFRQMALEDIDRLQQDLLAMAHNSKPISSSSSSSQFGMDDNNNFANNKEMLRRQNPNPNNARVASKLEEEPNDPTTLVDVPLDVQDRLQRMHDTLLGYYKTVRKDVRLDSKFDMFSPGISNAWLKGLITVLSMDAGEAFAKDLVSVTKQIRSGELSSAQMAIDECVSSATKYIALTEASSLVKGIINMVTLGVSDNVEDVGRGLSSADDVLEDISFATAQSGTTVLAAMRSPLGTSQREHIIDEGRSWAKIAGNAGNTTARVTGDVAYALLTFGIGPLIGFVAGKIVAAVETAWVRDKEISACILGAFGAMSEGLGFFSSVGAQGVQYRVKSDGQLLSDAGKFTDLLKRAKEEYDASLTRTIPNQRAGLISSEDVYGILDEDFMVLSKFKNVADIITAPGTGISETVRQYASGNEFEKAAKFAGPSLVAFLKNYYWKEFFLALTQGELTLSNAGFIKDLEVTGDIAYEPLYNRFGRSHNFGPGGEYDGSLGCGESGKCWLYCAGDYKSGKWCHMEDPFHENEPLKCSNKRDCYVTVAPIWTKFKDIRCASSCSE